jgi:ADP-ribose pyrophosphatase YjhB (NUDIX family)
MTQHRPIPVSLNRRYPPAPLVGVGVAVFNQAGQVLLVRRGSPPRMGQWGLPGGLLDLGERLVDAARREVWEECAVDVVVGDIVATFEPIEWDAEGRIEYHYVVIDFWARHRSGEAVAQDDAAAVVWVDPALLGPFTLSAETEKVIRQAHQAWIAASP